MTRLFFIIILTVLLSCTTTNSGKPESTSLKIELEIIPESDSSYTITWTDTLGQAKGYSLRNRPYELTCFFIDSKDTAGYYNGCSSPGNFTYITTKDSVVTAYFEMRLNFFTDAFSNEERKKLFENKKELKFDVVKIDIQNNLRKPFKLTLTEKKM